MSIPVTTPPPRTNLSRLPLAACPWQQQVVDRVMRALTLGRLGHALLIHGEPDLGQEHVADQLAHRLLQWGLTDQARLRCQQLLAAKTHPDYHEVGLSATKTGGNQQRSEIVIEQIRALSAKLALTPQLGLCQVAIINPADALNHAACNALLKTLEEPVAHRYLCLVTTRLAHLPATIRSRCQRFAVPLPAQSDTLAWLQAQGADSRSLRSALRIARGHPGWAARLLHGDELALRKQVRDDLMQIHQQQVSPSVLGQQWGQDDLATVRLCYAAEIAATMASKQWDQPMPLAQLVAWFDQVNHARSLLSTTVRADLLMTELLLAWQQLRLHTVPRRDQ